MPRPFAGSFSLQQANLEKPEQVRIQRVYRCQCGRIVFFPNTQCLACRSQLGYEPELGKVFALVPGPQTDTWWLATGRGRRQALYRRCANFNTPALCNWLVKTTPQATGGAQTFCRSCRLNRMIPDLTVAENGLLWGKIERAKRRVISTLISLTLPVASRVSEDPQRGLAFDFLRTPTGGPPVMTGHAGGIITLNIEEADDATRERTRVLMGEPYRTLVGHIRHEVGHYYWDRLIAGSDRVQDFRLLFGDERTDYGETLRRYHEQGPPADWPSRFVSAYASAHPWEDWAETWAHYLHMIDTVATAMSFGLDIGSIEMDFEEFTADLLYRPENAQSDGFLPFLNTWVKLTAVMNELTRSMGYQDFYPFTLPRTVVGKLQFIHLAAGPAGQTMASIVNTPQPLVAGADLAASSA